MILNSKRVRNNTLAHQRAKVEMEKKSLKKKDKHEFGKRVYQILQLHHPEHPVQHCSQ